MTFGCSAFKRDGRTATSLSSYPHVNEKNKESSIMRGLPVSNGCSILLVQILFAVCTACCLAEKGSR